MCCAVIVGGFGLGVDQKNVAGIKKVFNIIRNKTRIAYHLYTVVSP